MNNLYETNFQFNGQFYKIKHTYTIIKIFSNYQNIFETCYYDIQFHKQVWHKNIFGILTLKNKRIVKYKEIVMYVCKFCIIKVYNNIFYLILNF
jgi:hypothetical protein